MEKNLTDLDPHWINDNQDLNGLTFTCPVCPDPHVIRIKWANKEVPDQPNVTASGSTFETLTVSHFQYAPSCAFDGQIDSGVVSYDG